MYNTETGRAESHPCDALGLFETLRLVGNPGSERYRRKVEDLMGLNCGQPWGDECCDLLRSKDSFEI